MEKLEETMAEQINIIESMNRRQKSFMEGQDELKKNLMIRIQRLENDFISKTFEALDQKFDFKHFEQTVKKL
jgi:predicted nuclease with TOPRIM domain